ncbi:MAG: dihydrolipoyl dehydrogenase [Chloroflexales bacterium]|nr:dihydrolipoyl dehydrogenase [Chloroflexales bacterium]
MSDQVYDVVIVGAGPGGYVSAIRAAQLGLKVAIVERSMMGGVCLNVGCIPTKALLHTADLLEEIHESAKFGINTTGVSLDWDASIKNKDGIVKQMTQGVSFLMKKNKVDVIMGAAALGDRGNVVVTGADGASSKIATKNTIIATGAKPREIPQIGAIFDGERIMSSWQALSMKSIPKSLLIVGAGAIGVEFASMFCTFGSKVTLVESLPRIVPNEDEEISAELDKALSKRGITIMTGAKLQNVGHQGSGVRAVVINAAGKEVIIDTERALIGIGIAPNTKDLGLEARGVTLDQRGFVHVDAMMQTSAEGVYAIGDCAITTPWLAHKSSAEGILAAEAIAGHHPKAINYGIIPACTYCTPSIASVGLTEAKAREQGYDVRVGKFSFAGNGKATILGQRSGFVKIIAEKKYDAVLGMHLIGPNVTELIAEGALALSHEATAESLMRTIHAHPTLYEALGEAAHAAAEGAAIHM